MWGPLLALSVLAALNPVRLSLVLLVLARPRPFPSLFAFWVGAVVISVAALLIPLIAVHYVPMLDGLARDLGHPGANSRPVVRTVQTAMGGLALTVAALLAVRCYATERARVPAAPAPGSHAEAAPLPFRVLTRARTAWEGGSPWAALILGLCSGLTVDGAFYVLAVVVGSGAAFGTQVLAALGFVVGMLLVVETLLVGNLLAPMRARVAVQLLHGWTRAHRAPLAIAMFTVLGVSLLFQGIR
jgi:hypothetical protein